MHGADDTGSGRDDIDEQYPTQFGSPSAHPGEIEDGWAVVDEPSTSANGHAPRRRRRSLRRSAVGIATAALLCIAMFVMTTVFGNNKAAAEVGHPDHLRPGCTWDRSGNFVQNCKVHSNSMNKDIVVQIRASNGDAHGIYLLDGMRARDDRSAWTTDVQAAKVYDGSTNTNLVMPAGGASSFYTDWNGGAGDKNAAIKQETFLTQELPDYLSDQFGMSKVDNAIVGLSMSGGPAVNLAERHPDQFKVVQSMSGYYQTDNPIGALGVFATQSVVSNYTNGIFNMWGLPGSKQWADNDPSKNVGKLKKNGQVLIISSGNGFLTPSEMAKLSPQDQFNSIALEILSAVSTILMQMQAKQSGVSVISLPNYGGHDWENWGRALADGRKDVLDGMRNTPPVTASTQLMAADGSKSRDGEAKAKAAGDKAAKSEGVLAATLSRRSSDASPSASESASASAAPSKSTAPSKSAAPSTAAAPSEDQGATTSSSAPSSVAPTQAPSTAAAAPAAPPAAAAASAPASGSPSTTTTTTAPAR